MGLFGMLGHWRADWTGLCHGYSAASVAPRSYTSPQGRFDSRDSSGVCGVSEGEIVLYRTPDGLTEIQLRAIDGTVWLTQAQIAELFQVSPQNVTIHIRNILAEGELSEEATCKQDLQVRTEGGAGCLPS